MDRSRSGCGRAGEVHHAGQQSGGIILTIVLGVVGALVGGLLGTYVFGFGDITGFNLRSIAIAVGGALLVLFVYGMIGRRGHA